MARTRAMEVRVTRARDRRRRGEGVEATRARQSAENNANGNACRDGDSTRREGTEREDATATREVTSSTRGARWKGE